MSLVDTRFALGRISLLEGLTPPAAARIPLKKKADNNIQALVNQ